MTRRHFASLALLVPAAPCVTSPARAAPTSPRAGHQRPPEISRTTPRLPGRVALTFDDGPYADKTPKVLDALGDERSTFFVVGRFITAKTYALLQRMERDGHDIGSHSYDHDIAMASRGREATRYVHAQHAITRALIQIALLATSAEDFEDLHRSVLGISSAARLPRHTLAARAGEIERRVRGVCRDRGWAASAGRYSVRHSRPPGGGPYLGRARRLQARYDRALRELEMTNVLWHADTGDARPTRAARDARRIAARMAAAGRRGGVLLGHDFIPVRGLQMGLKRLRDDGVTIESLDDAFQRQRDASASPVRRD
ncbi:MAG: polysaccharide deacetylase family protein [Myxococcota bacterium]